MEAHGGVLSSFEILPPNHVTRQSLEIVGLSQDVLMQDMHVDDIMSNTGNSQRAEFCANNHLPGSISSTTLNASSKCDPCVRPNVTPVRICRSFSIICHFGSYWSIVLFRTTTLYPCTVVSVLGCRSLWNHKCCPSLHFIFRATSMSTTFCFSW